MSYAMAVLRTLLPCRSIDRHRSVTEFTPGARCQAPATDRGASALRAPRGSIGATAPRAALPRPRRQRSPRDRPRHDPNDVAPAVANLETIVSLSKRRGFIFPSSEIYGGINAVWDYGPLGVELKNNVKRAWWRAMVQERDDIVGPRRGHPHAPAGVGHVGPRRVVQRPAGRVRDRPAALPPRRAARRRGPHARPSCATRASSSGSACAARSTAGRCRRRAAST